MTQPKLDDLEAVRAVVDALKDFPPEDQQRIFRWSAEKLGLAPLASPSSPPPALRPHGVPASNTSPHQPHHPDPAAAADIRSFIDAKKPRNDVQFAAAVAYYHRFEAPLTEKKEAINKDDLQEAARKASRERFSNPIVTLTNAHKLGLLDRTGEKGYFSINSVGENLVAMTLPDGAPIKRRPAREESEVVKAKPKRRKA